MFDAAVAFRQWLVGESTITDLVPAAKIVGGDLPQGANPGAGEKWITFHIRGGEGHSEIRDLVYPSFAITFWAKKDGLIDAREVYRAFRDLGYNTQSEAVSEAVIICAEEEVQGQDLTDPDTEWAMCVTYWTVTMRST